VAERGDHAPAGLRLLAVLLGPPGAGKGTQARQVGEHFEVPQISTGDILRANVAGGTELGRKAREFMDKGELVPDGLIVDLIAERIAEPDAAEGFLLDGFPRTIPQAVALDDLLRHRGLPLQHVVLIEVPDEEIVRRISGRWLCQDCGQDVNTAGRDQVPETCPNCGGPFYQRDDDQPETVRRRLRIYRELTAPLIEYYEGKGLLEPVDGMGSAGVVTDRVLDVLGKPRQESVD
jgi:adenylate kinase